MNDEKVKEVKEFEKAVEPLLGDKKRLDRVWNAHQCYSGMEDAQGTGTGDPVLDKIVAEALQWEEQGRIEDSPLGGNCVKAAMYKGTAVGLRMAQGIILEHLSNARNQGLAPKGENHE